VSADGHPVDGNYVFFVGLSDTTVKMVAPPSHVAEGFDSGGLGPSVAQAPVIPGVLRGVALGCLMALTGMLLLLAWGPVSLATRPGRSAVWLAMLTPVFLAAHGVAWLLNASPDAQVDGAWAWSALGTGSGRVELWRVGLSLLALWALALARRPALALAFALGALLVSGASGHSAAIRAGWAIPSKALHLVAGAAWLGGLLWLVLRERDDLPRFIDEAARVSSVALLAVVGVTISGVAQTLLFLPSVLDVIRSAYGAIVIAKVAGSVVLIAFGAYHRFRVVPRLREQHVAAGFARTVRRELAVMYAVVLLGGFLAYVPPPAAPAEAHTLNSDSTQ
jgi:putative copper export protein